MTAASHLLMQGAESEKPSEFWKNSDLGGTNYSKVRLYIFATDPEADADDEVRLGMQRVSVG